MADSSKEITDIIKAKIKGFKGGAESVDVGTVVEIGDGIARVYGLANCMASELLDFGNDVFGLAFNLEEDTVSAIILGDYTGIVEGGEVRTTGRIVETPVGEALVGRVVDPLGRPLDGKGPINTKTSLPVDVAPECGRSRMIGLSRWCQFWGAPFWSTRSSNCATRVLNES